MKHKKIFSEAEIYGQHYKITGVAGEKYIEELACYVDKKMREIAEATHTVDTLKLAILTAINITDEFFQLKRKLEKAEKAITEKAEKFEQLLRQID